MQQLNPGSRSTYLIEAANSLKKACMEIIFHSKLRKWYDNGNDGPNYSDSVILWLIPSMIERFKPI
jgi:hypothetical protein